MNTRDYLNAKFRLKKYNLSHLNNMTKSLYN